VIEKEGLMQNAEAMGRLLMEGLRRELAGVAGVKEIRGMGLMIGIELDRPCGDIVKRALEAGLVTNVTADKVIRLLPALVIRKNEAEMLVEILAPLIKRFLAQAPAAAAA
jgi:acetylornithine aminotransferase